ncbi:MAG: hypothetical protein JNK72_23800 [Myxococcales bacterium]|nr:hypothetical protein [Myxococcales bacterium]
MAEQDSAAAATIDPARSTWAVKISEQRPQLLAAATAAALLMGPLVCFGGIALSVFFGSALGEWLMILSLIGQGMVLGAPFLALLTRFLLLRGDGLAWVRDGTLYLGNSRKTRSHRVDTLREGIVKQWGASAKVQLTVDARQQYELIVHNVDTGHAMLEALSLDGWMRRCTVVMRRETRRVNAFALYGLATVLATAPMLAALAFASPLALTLSLGLLPMLSLGGLVRRWRRDRDREVVVGRDAIRFVDAEGSARVVPAALVASASIEGRDAALALRDGTRLVVPADGDYNEELEALVDRINAVAAETREVTEATTQSLQREDRSPAQWHAYLSTLLSRESYRSASLSRDALSAVLNDGTLGLDLRVAAALALVGQQRDPASLTQVRMAAEGSSDTRVRAHLLEALDGKLDAARLGDIEHEEAHKKR